MRAVSLVFLFVATPEQWAPFRAIVERYRVGETEAAIEALIALGPDGLRRSKLAVAQSPGEPETDARAAAMLHTDTAEAFWRINPLVSAQHVEVARGWAARAEKPSPEFRRWWYLAAGLLLVELGARDGNLDAALDHFDQACRDLPGNVTILTVTAWVEETRALAPVVWDQRRDPSGMHPRRLKQQYLTKAHERLDAVLRIEPAAVEAALRLGRIRALRGNRAGAKRVLEPLLTRDGVADRIAYLARVLLARIMEAEGKPDQAIRLYRDAIARVPGAAAARTGLARLLYSSNDRAGAQATLLPVLSSGTGTSPPDPWVEYLTAHMDQARPLRRTLRAEAQR